MHTEKTLSSEIIFNGKIFTLEKREIELQNGQKTVREIINHHGGVGVLPILDDGTVILVKQYRSGAQDVLLEIPAGKLNQGEDHRACGIRELEEETGYTAKDVTYLGYFYPTPAYDSEKTHMYLARGLTPGKAHPDENEFVETVKMPFEQLLNMVINNEIKDAKTISAVLMADKLLK